MTEGGCEFFNFIYQCFNCELRFNLFQSRNKKDFDLVICNNILRISRQVIDQMAWNATIAMKDSTEAWIDISNYWID